MKNTTRPSLLAQDELDELYRNAPLPPGYSLLETGLFHQVSGKDGKYRDTRIGDPIAFVAHFDMPDGTVRVGIAFPSHTGAVASITLA